MNTPENSTNKGSNQFRKYHKNENYQRRLGFYSGLIIAMIAVLTAFSIRTPVIDDPYVDFPMDTIPADLNTIIPIREKIEEKKEIKTKEKSDQPKALEKTVEPKSTDKIEIDNTEEGKEDDMDFDLDKITLPDEVIVEDNKIYPIVQKYPAFKNGCEKLESDKERYDCTYREMYRFFNNHKNYPHREYELGMEAVVYVGFVVEKDGSISSVEIQNNDLVTRGFANEVIRLVKLLPDFDPGENRGKKVRVKYTLPIQFKLL